MSKTVEERFPNTTPRPWKLREGTSVVCSDDHRADVLIIVGQVSAGTLKTKRAQENAALTLEAVNSYDTLRAAAEQVVRAVQFSLTTPGLIKGRDELKAAVVSMTAALSPKEQTQ